MYRFKKYEDVFKGVPVWCATNNIKVKYKRKTNISKTNVITFKRGDDAMDNLDNFIKWWYIHIAKINKPYESRGIRRDVRLRLEDLVYATNNGSSLIHHVTCCNWSIAENLANEIYKELCPHLGIVYREFPLEEKPYISLSTL